MLSSRSALVAALALPVVTLLAGAVSGCRPLCDDAVTLAAPRPGTNEESGDNGAARPAPVESAGGAAAPASSADAARAVSEADIVQLDPEKNWLYAISRSGTLAIVDASTPGALSLLGKLPLPGVPFEMYRRGDALLVLANQARSADGTLLAAQPEDAAPRPPEATAGAVVTAVDITTPASARVLGSFPVPGEVADSRIVGNVLYLATYENAACFGCGRDPRTLVTTFDVTAPEAPRRIDQVTFTAPAVTSGTGTWATPWKRAVVATDQRLYVGGLSANPAASTNEGIIEVLDISDPAGHLVRGASLTTAGPVLSRWQMDEHAGYLRVVTQRGAGRTTNGEAYPDIDTFRIESTASMPRIGHTTMHLPQQEGLKAVRFDGERAYAITYPQIDQVLTNDPLFTIDLSDPAHPAQRGELEIPGWVYHLVPRGDRLIGLGLDTNDAGGNLNVSLFDVSEMRTPTMLQRVSFGPTHLFQDRQVTTAVLAEDQDRIQKAFRVFDDGLVVVPFSSPGVGSNDTCSGVGSGIQLLEWSRTGLVKRALLPMQGNPRRALRRDSASMQELLAVSDSHMQAFDIGARDVVRPLADVRIGTCVPRIAETQGGLGGEGGTWRGGGGRGGRGDWYDSSPRASSCY